MSNTILNTIEIPRSNTMTRLPGAWTLKQFYTPEMVGHTRAYGSGGLPWPDLAVVSARGAKYSKTSESPLLLMNLTMVQHLTHTARTITTPVWPTWQATSHHSKESSLGEMKDSDKHWSWPVWGRS